MAGARLRGNDLVPGGLGKAAVLLSELVRQNKVPGLAVTARREGRVFFQKGYGYADLATKVPVNPRRTIFRVGSVSKPIAATALAKMVEEGTIALDASFYDYVPYYPKKEFDFTIRQLAGHMAGIRTYKGKEYGNNEPFTIREGIRIFKDDPLYFEPGTDYLYNSYGWVLISLAMQEASGIPFEVYVKRRVLDPLGMSHTYPEHPGES
ncbi:MAG TPA: serine hydrolase domain-containing protein, partial [Eudoraea sp.]|nr:serine hydrolase domain-containing protein [Eudoraea sp.]